MRNLISLPINTIFEKLNYDLKIIKPFPHWIVLVTMKGYSGSCGTWNTMLLEKPECHESLAVTEDNREMHYTQQSRMNETLLFATIFIFLQPFQCF